MDVLGLSTRQAMKESFTDSETPDRSVGHRRTVTDPTEDVPRVMLSLSKHRHHSCHCGLSTRTTNCHIPTTSESCQVQYALRVGKIAYMTSEEPLVIEGYRFVRDQEIAFRDIDFFRHVNNAAYIAWTENARIEYMLEVLRVPLDAGVRIIMASQAFDYFYPVAYRERIVVGTRCSRLGTKSFDLQYEIWSRTAEKLAVRGSSTIVAYDYGEARSVVIPDVWRDKITAFEPQRPA
jgi:acyl-CoA thioester hydrolase